MATTFPPGPRWPILGSLIAPGRDPLRFFSGLAATYGDLVHFRMMGEHAFLVSRPEIIRDVLTTSSRNFTKSRGLDRARILLGDGLLTSEGATHLRSRRLLQPAFHRERIDGYARVMAEYARRETGRWTPGAPFDAARAMSRLTLAIVGKTLFDADVEASADEIGDALTRVLESFWTMLLPFPALVRRLPFPALRRAEAARAHLDRVIYD